MRILFTGHRGFLGRELIPELGGFCQILKYEGDLRNRESLNDFVRVNKPDLIIHAAAKGVSRNEIQSERTLCDNLKMSTNIAFIGLPTIFFCSGKIYGYQLPIEGVSESECLSRYPNDFYGQSKFLSFDIFKEFENVTFLRFFNVFGSSESDYRFIRANISRNFQNRPMLIHQDIIMDTFYAKDTIPILKAWIRGDKVPKNINLVYKNKLRLSDICSIINDISTSKVEIEIQNKLQGNNYYGNGSLIEELNFSLKGLREGISEVMSELRDLQSASSRKGIKEQ